VDATPRYSSCRILGQHGGHRVLVGIEERWLRAALVLRWFRQLEQAADSVAAHLQPSGDRCLGQALAVKPVNVGPVVH